MSGIPPKDLRVHIGGIYEVHDGVYVRVFDMSDEYFRFRVFFRHEGSSVPGWGCGTTPGIGVSGRVCAMGFHSPASHEKREDPWNFQREITP